MACIYTYNNKQYTKPELLAEIMVGNIYIKGDKTSATNWLNDKFGEANVEYVAGLINGNAFGQFQEDGKILLSELFEKGTEYHEAFHRVFQTMLSPEQRSSIIKEIKASSPDLTEIKRLYPELSEERQVEEYLAELFREYVINDGNMQLPKQSKSFFQRLYELIQKLFGKKQLDVTELFEKINTGGFKDVKVEYPGVESYMKSSVFDIEDKVEITKAVAHNFLNRLFSDDHHAFTAFIENRLDPNYITARLENAIGETFENLGGTETSYEAGEVNLPNTLVDNMDEIILSVKDYLSQFNIDITVDENDNKTEDDKDYAFYKVAFDTDDTTRFSQLVKLLLASVQSQKPSTKLGLPISTEWNELSSQLSIKLSGIVPSTSNLFRALRDLNTPETNQLLQLLGGTNTEFKKEIEKDFNKNLPRFYLRQQFFNSFTKHFYEFRVGRFKGNNIFLFDANQETNEKRVEQEYKDKFQSDYQRVVEYVNNNKDVFEGTTIPEKVVDFYKKSEYQFLNRKNDLQFSSEALFNDPKRLLNLVVSNKNDKEGNVSKSPLEALKSIEKYLHDSLKPSDSFEEFYQQINSYVNSIARVEARYRAEVNLSIQNVEGNSVFPVNLHTWQSLVTDGISYYMNLSEEALDEEIDEIQAEGLANNYDWSGNTNFDVLKIRMPFLFNAYTQNSQWLKAIEKGIVPKIIVIDGINPQSQVDAKSTSNLVNTDLYAVQLATTWSGSNTFAYPSIQHADRSTFYGYEFPYKKGFEEYEFTVGKGNQVITETRFKNLYDGYLSDQENVQRVANETKAFEAIKHLPKGNQKNILPSNIDGVQYLRKRVEEIRAEFNKYQLLRRLEDGRPIGISEELWKAAGEDIDSILYYIAATTTVGYIEQTKLFTGNPAFYSSAVDFYKRMSMQSSTGTPSSVDALTNYVLERMNKATADKFDQEYNKPIDGQITEIVATENSKYVSKHEDYIKAITGSGYGGINENDGQSWINLFAFREFFLRTGKWNEPLQKAFDMEMYILKNGTGAFYDWLKNDWVYSYVNAFHNNDPDKLKFYQDNPEEITAVYHKQFIEPFRPIKGQYTGFVYPDGRVNYTNMREEDRLMAPAGRKTSYFPLIPSMIEGTNLGELNRFLIENGIDINHMQSGAKFGIKTTIDLYDKDGNFNVPKSFDKNTHQSYLDWRYMKNQLDISPKEKSRIIDSTQARKNQLANFRKPPIVKTVKVNDIKLNTGDIELNTGQKEALNKLADFIDSGEKTFVLSGYAGTGKTTLLKVFDKYLNTKNRFAQIKYSSPTHRANAVLRQKNPDAVVHTLHSLFGLSPEIDLEKFDSKNAKFVQQNTTKVEYGDIVIIDESSMINDELFKFLTDSAAPLNLKIIFVGDPEQIKPVGQEHISKAFTDIKDSAELTKVERTGDNPLLKESLRIRTNKKSPMSYKTEVNDKGEGVVYTNSKSGFLNKATDLFTSKEFNDNPLLVRVLAGTNQAVSEYNNVIRKGIWGEDSKNEYNVGEVLMGYANWKVDYFTKLPEINNGGDYLVEEVIPESVNINGIKVNGFYLRVRDLINEGDIRYVYILSQKTDGATLAKLGEEFERLRQEAMSYPKGSKQAAIAWKALAAFKDSFATPVDISYKNETKINRTLKYGYAHTIHKSQGGTYTYSFVDDNSIEQGFKSDAELRRQLKYVGVTRSEKVSTVLSNRSEVSDTVLPDNTYKPIAYTKKETISEWKDKQLANDYIQLHQELVNRALDEINKVVGGLDVNKKEAVQKIVDRVKDIKKGSPENIFNALDLLTEVGFLEMLPNRNKIEPILFSFITNEGIKIKRNGNSAVQVSVSMLEQGKRKSKDGKLLASDELKFYFDEAGNIQEAEIMMPLPQQWIKPILKRYKTHNLAKAIDQLNSELAEGKYKDQVTIKGLRIPNQQMSSNDIFRVKKFFLPTVSNSVVVPAEMVAKTGSDFDIDKLNLYFPNVDSEWNYIKPEGNVPEMSIEQLENRLIQIERDILLHPENIDQTLKLLDGGLIYGDKKGKEPGMENSVFEDLKETLKKSLDNFPKDSVAYKTIERRITNMENLESLPFEEIPKFTQQIQQKNQGTDAKYGVGIVATEITGHTLFQLHNIQVAQEIYVDGVDAKGKPTKVRIDTRVFSVGEDRYALNSIVDTEGNVITEVLSMLLTSQVDALKKPYAPLLVINNETLDVITYMMRRGESIRNAVYLINQPIVQRYILQKTINNSLLFRHNQNKKDKNGVQIRRSEKEIESYVRDTSTNTVDAENNDYFTNLLNNTNQHEMLDRYLAIKKQTSIMLEAKKYLQPDTTSLKNMMSTEIAEQAEKDTLESKLLINIEDIKSGLLKGFFAVQDTYRAYQPLYFMYGISGYKEQLSTLGGHLNKETQQKMFDKLNSDFVLYLMDRLPEFEGKFNELFTSKNNIAKRVIDYKGDNPFVNSLRVKLVEENHPVHGNIPSIKFMESTDTFNANRLMEHFLSLKTEDPELYKDLIIASLLQSSINPSPFSWISVFPNNDFDAQLFRDAFDIKPENISMNNYLLEFFSENPEFAPTNLRRTDNPFFINNKVKRVWEDGRYKISIMGKKKERSGSYHKKDYTYSGSDVAPMYQKVSRDSIDEIIASEKTIRDVAERMADRIGLRVKYISNRTLDYKGRLEGNTAVINLANATLDTPIHEILGHPIIRTIKENKAKYNFEFDMPSGEFWVTENGKRIKKFKYGSDAQEYIKNIPKEENSLYQNLLKELEYGKGKEVLDRIKRDYQIKENGSKYTLEEQQEEAIVELLGLYTANRLNNVKDGKLISLLKRLLKEMKAFLRRLFNQKEINIDQLPESITLSDLADLLAYSNSKLILPGNEVVYTTPDNQQFKTYAEASKHISELTRNVKDIDFNKVTLKQKVTNIEQVPPYFRVKDAFNDRNVVKRANGTWFVSGHTYKNFTQEEIEQIRNEVAGHVSSEKYVIKLFNLSLGDFPLESFIDRNKEFEQSKEIIEEWKKVNSIKYDPEEVYSRGQEFVSVVGAYSDFDVELMLQNLLEHISDNKKAGGQFAISALTKPVNKRLTHIEGDGGKLRYKIYPKSEDILWASNIDVYSGSVWDASEKVNKDKKSELLGVSYTKYPALAKIDSVQPNLASIIDNIDHAHNELGIVLTGENFRLEYDEDVPYSTKKLINGINSILDRKYGKLSKPVVSIDRKQPTQTKENLKESIIKVQQKLDNRYNILPDKFVTEGKNKGFASDSWFYKQNEEWYIKYVPFGAPFETKVEDDQIFKLSDGGLGIDEVWESYISNNPDGIKNIEFKEKEYTSQALVNIKVNALKQGAKKYSRIFIRSKVQPIVEGAYGKYYGDDLFELPEDLPFQKVRGSKNKITGQLVDVARETQFGYLPKEEQLKIEQFLQDGEISGEFC